MPQRMVVCVYPVSGVMITAMEPRIMTTPSPAPMVTLAQIKAALEEVPVSRLPDVYAYLIELQEDAEDLVICDGRKDEVGIPLDNALGELGFTREELMEAARTEGLVK